MKREELLTEFNESNQAKINLLLKKQEELEILQKLIDKLSFSYWFDQFYGLKARYIGSGVANHKFEIKKDDVVFIRRIFPVNVSGKVCGVLYDVSRDDDEVGVDLRVAIERPLKGTGLMPKTDNSIGVAWEDIEWLN